MLFFYVADLWWPSLHPWRISSNTNVDQWLHDEPFNPWRTMAAYIVPLAVFDYCFPRRSLVEAPPTAIGLVTGVVLLLIVYDALFFICHKTMHDVPWLYQQLHAEHHHQKVT